MGRSIEDCARRVFVLGLHQFTEVVLKMGKCAEKSMVGNKFVNPRFYDFAGNSAVLACPSNGMRVKHVYDDKGLVP